MAMHAAARVYARAGPRVDKLIPALYRVIVKHAVTSRRYFRGRIFGTRQFFSDSRAELEENVSKFREVSSL